MSQRQMCAGVRAGCVQIFADEQERGEARRGEARRGEAGRGHASSGSACEVAAGFLGRPARRDWNIASESSASVYSSGRLKLRWPEDVAANGRYGCRETPFKLAVKQHTDNIHM
jgi:hypothetical protein